MSIQETLRGMRAVPTESQKDKDEQVVRKAVEATVALRHFAQDKEMEIRELRRRRAAY